MERVGLGAAADRWALLALWADMGRPLVPLGPGVYVRDLARWLDGLEPPSDEDIQLVRRTLVRWHPNWAYLRGQQVLEDCLRQT